MNGAESLKIFLKKYHHNTKLKKLLLIKMMDLYMKIF